MNKPKVIGVGFQKTGTTSLCDALQLLGYKVGDNNYKLLPAILRGRWKKVFRVFEKFDAVEDNPWPLIYKELDQQYPGSKFILTVRDSQSWYRSVANHIGTLKNPMHEWIYGAGKSLPKFHQSNTIAVYEKHNADVLEYFKNRTEDLLVIDITQEPEWKKICDFLHVPVPAQPFPHRNNAQLAQRKLRDVLNLKKKAVKYFFQIQFYRMMGWLH